MKLKDFNAKSWKKGAAKMQTELENGAGLPAGAFNTLQKFKKVRAFAGYIN